MPILGKIDDFESRRKFIEVDVPELGGSYRLRALSSAQFGILAKEPDVTRGVRQLFLSIVDENGQRIYTSDEDFKNLGEMPASISVILLTASNELNGFTKNETDDTAKKFEASQSTGSVLN